MTNVEPRTPAEITTLARQIVTGDLMVVDLEDRDWQMSMMLILSLWESIPENIGLIVVPLKDHASGRWLSGRVPGVTMRCFLVATEDLPFLKAEVDRMNAALWPEAAETKEEKEL
jgi:hypothetical protein